MNSSSKHQREKYIQRCREGKQLPSPQSQPNLPYTTQPKAHKHAEPREHPAGERRPCRAGLEEDTVQQEQHCHQVEGRGAGDGRADEAKGCGVEKLRSKYCEEVSENLSWKRK